MTDDTTTTDLSYTDEEVDIINNIKTITNDFKKTLSSTDEDAILKIKKIIKTAKIRTNKSYFNTDNEEDLFDYNEAIAYFCCSELLILKNSSNFSLGNDKKDIKAGMLEVENSSSSYNDKNYDDNFYKNEWNKIIKRYFEKQNGPVEYGCISSKIFKL